jgi:DNA polymerase III subunit gamma/tau
VAIVAKPEKPSNGEDVNLTNTHSDKPAPPKKVGINTNLKLKSKTSIAGIIQKKEQEEQGNAALIFNPDDLPKTEFSVETFMGKWMRYCYQLKEEGKETLYGALTKRKPTLEANFGVKLIIDNKVQEDYINSIKPDLLDFLRKELNNYSISLALHVEQTTDDKVAYTGKEKFDKMAQTNPNLIKLQQALKLMVE